MLESICHPNITQFIGVCSKPVEITMDYECFNFSTFGLNHQISNLLEFLNTLDHIEGETEALSISCLFFRRLKRTSWKVSVFFIHDLKPSNVLVSNRHYCKKYISADQLPSVFADCPVVCKLADFGESRSTLLQTACIIHAKTMNIERGTKPYMARREIELREAGTGVMTMIIKILKRRRHSMEKKWSKCRLLCCFKLVPLRGKNVWKPRPSGVILVPFSVFSEKEPMGNEGRPL